MGQVPEEPSDRPEFYAQEEPLRIYVEEALEASPVLQESLACYRAALKSSEVTSAIQVERESQFERIGSDSKSRMN